MVIKYILLVLLLGLDWKVGGLELENLRSGTEVSLQPRQMPSDLNMGRRLWIS